ncbi:MAG: Uma2 family endonuclease [Deltaproteobacteria bacterium]|nr:Uma2 family endonuclease [Deltaproteobacteria bacterium]
MATPNRRRATLADILPFLAREEQVELVDGEIVPRAMPSASHGATQLGFGDVLGPFRRRAGDPRGPGGWWIFSELDVHYEQTDEVFRHDVCGYRRDRHAERPSGAVVSARPDWVCEILSTNRRRAFIEKQRTLHRHAVPHYWLFDPDAEVLSVLRWSEPGYVVILNAGAGETVRAEPFDAIEIVVDELLGKD